MNAFGKLRLLRNALGAPPPVAETRAAWWMAIGRAAGLLALALAAAWMAFRLGMRPAPPLRVASA